MCSSIADVDWYRVSQQPELVEVHQGSSDLGCCIFALIYCDRVAENAKSNGVDNPAHRSLPVRAVRCALNQYTGEITAEYCKLRTLPTCLR